MTGEIRVSGKLVGVDSKSGRVLWSHDIEDQKLRTTQPFGLPVLVAYNSFQRPTQVNNRFSYGSPISNLDCLDTRSGKVLGTSRQKIAGRYPYYQLRFDDESKTAIIDTRAESLELRFVSP
jgi:hypothetical protein